MDDLAWAAAWLYRATGEEAYLTDAKAFLAKAELGESPTFETGWVVREGRGGEHRIFLGCCLV